MKVAFPRLEVATPPNNVGVVAQPYVELVIRPNCAAPGLVDVEMEGGGWVGFDPATKRRPSRRAWRPGRVTLRSPDPDVATELAIDRHRALW